MYFNLEPEGAHVKVLPLFFSLLKLSKRKKSPMKQISLTVSSIVRSQGLIFLNCLDYWRSFLYRYVSLSKEENIVVYCSFVFSFYRINFWIK